jgi:outer membrane protein TolC
VTFTYRWSIVILLLFGTCHSPSALAAEAGAISCSLQACLERAFAHHPLLKVGAARQSAARAQLDVRLAERQPTLNLEGETGFLEGKAITPFSALSGVTEEGDTQRRVSGGYYQATVGLDVPLVKDGTLYGQPSASVHQAELKISEEEWQHHVFRLQVATKVVAAYVQVLKQRKAVHFRRAIVTALADSYKLTHARFQQRLIARHDLLTAEVRSATAQRDLTLAGLDLQNSQQVLAVAMGLDQGSVVDIEDLPEAPAPLPALDTLLSRARQAHPALKARQFRVQGSIEEVSRVQSERYPSLSLSARYGLVDAYEGSLNDQWLTALKVKVPLFDFGVIRHKAAVAQARVVEEEQRLYDVQLGVEQEIHTLHLRLQTLEDEAIVAKIRIEQATEELRFKRAMAQQQLLPPSAALDAEADVLKWQLALAETEYDQRLVRLQLRLAIGAWDLTPP